MFKVLSVKPRPDPSGEISICFSWAGMNGVGHGEVLSAEGNGENGRDELRAQPLSSSPQIISHTIALDCGEPDRNPPML